MGQEEYASGRQKEDIRKRRDHQGIKWDEKQQIEGGYWGNMSHAIDSSKVTFRLSNTRPDP